VNVAAHLLARLRSRLVPRAERRVHGYVTPDGLWFAVRALERAASGTVGYTAEPFIEVDDQNRLIAAGIRFRVPDFQAVYTLTLHYPAGTCTTDIEVLVAGGKPGSGWYRNRPGTRPGEPWFPQPVPGCIRWVERMQAAGALSRNLDVKGVAGDRRP